VLQRDLDRLGRARAADASGMHPQPRRAVVGWHRHHQRAPRLDGDLAVRREHLLEGVEAVQPAAREHLSVVGHHVYAFARALAAAGPGRSLRRQRGLSDAPLPAVALEKHPVGLVGHGS
jgi:hypothetical protein